MTGVIVAALLFPIIMWIMRTSASGGASMSTSVPRGEQ